MVLAFHQPNFLPNLGFFYKMAQADLFVVVSNVQFSRGEGWQRRHKIAGRDKDLWLTVPVRGSQNDLIKDVLISDHDDWRRKHIKTLRLSYADTSEQDFLDALEEVYRREWRRLVDLNMALILLLKDALGVTTSIVLDEDVAGEKEFLITNICQKYSADAYLSGRGGRHYMTDRYYRAMKECGIDCQFVSRDLTGSYPYSSAHYLLGQGRETVRALL